MPATTSTIEPPRSSPPPSPLADKPAIRRHVRSGVEAMTPDERAAASLRICARVLAAPFVDRAATVMLYWPLPGEVDVRHLVHAFLMLRVRVCLPRVNWAAGTGGMEAVPIDSPEQLVPSRHGIMQPPAPPASPPALRPEQIDLVIVPGLAFDPRGTRLGRGGGFYDRFLADPALGAFTCGVAFGVQLFATLPATPSDVPVRAIATEDNIFMIHAQAG